MVLALPAPTLAQYPVTAVVPVRPAIVGYVPEQRGLLGFRTVYRPVVVPITTAFAEASAVTLARPITVSPPVVVRYSTVAPRVTTYYAPSVPVTPTVTTYYAPAPPAVPLTTYRTPATTWVPVVGF